jgi:hypothetical protein
MTTGYYIITKESDLYVNFVEREKAVEEISKAFCEFSKAHGINATQFYPSPNHLAIFPIEDDYKNFEKEFLKNQYKDDLCEFKKTSQTCKDWVAFCKTKGLKNPRDAKAHPIFYFDNALGKTHSQLFMAGDQLYCSFESAAEQETPKGFIRIKASEFYKAIEDYEEKQKKEENQDGTTNIQF